MKNILLIGTSMKDYIFSTKHLEAKQCNKGSLTESFGGSMHNVSYNLGCLGAHPIFFTKLGNDEIATRLKDELTLIGVEVQPFFVDLPTPIFQSIRAENTHFFLSTITHDFFFNEKDNFDLSLFRDSYVVTDQVNEPLLYHCMINSSSAKWICSGFIPSIKLQKYVTGIVLNADECDETLIDFTSGLEWVIVTQGTHGAFLLTKDNKQAFPCTSINTPNSLGAGDAFLSGILYGLSKSLTISESILLAHKAAAIILETPSAINNDLKLLQQ